MNKPQGWPPHINMPKNWEGKIEIERNGKDDNHKDVGLEFCTFRPGNDKRARGNDLLQCNWASLHARNTS